MLLFFAVSKEGFSQGALKFNKAEIEKALKGMSSKKAADSLVKYVNHFREASSEECIKALDFALKYSELHELKGISKGRIYLRFAQTYRDMRKFFLCKTYLLRSEEYFVNKEDKVGLQETYLSLANLYQLLNENVESIKWALRAKDLALELGHYESIGVSYNTIANLYLAQKEYSSSLQYYKRALEILKRKNDHRQQAFILDNIALVYYELKISDSAEAYSKRALAIAYKHKDRMLELQLIPNACGVYEMKKDHKRQMEMALRGCFLADSLGHDIYRAYSDVNYAVALNYYGKPKEAITVFKSVVDDLIMYADDNALESIYFELSRAYQMLGQDDSSLFYYKKFSVKKDSLTKKKGLAEVQAILAKFDMDQKEKEINTLNTLNATLGERDTLKSMVIYGSIVLLLIILVLLIITFKRFRDNKKLSKEIGLKNLALVTKNNEITDSINYAKRIQQALLPSQKELTNAFPDSFILFKPKDIVSGDFYWIHHEADTVFIAVGDCTGHGVPGGFMSMLGHSFLNQIVNEKHVHEPAKILDQLREKVITSLRQTGAAGENKDGMDITFVMIDRKKNKLVYAAANNSFYLMQNGQITEQTADSSAESSVVLTELKADKQPIGYYSNVLRPFTQHEMDIQKGNAIYLFSDGYPDQFGGVKGKKLKHSSLQKLLIEGSSNTMQKQAEVLEKAFVTWKGNYEQTDDVCVVGIRI